MNTKTFLGLIAFSIATSLTAWSAEPELKQGVYSLEGRIVWCKEAKHESIRGFRFDGWAGQIRNLPEPQLLLSFMPRFLRCKKQTDSTYGWVEDLDYRKENRLAAGFYEPGFLGSESLQGLNYFEFPSVQEGLLSRLTLEFSLSKFFSEDERDTLKAGKILTKTGMFYPWPKNRWEQPEDGIPGEVYSWASWYDLKMTFQQGSDGKLQLKSAEVGRSGQGR